MISIIKSKMNKIPTKQGRRLRKTDQTHDLRSRIGAFVGAGRRHVHCKNERNKWNAVSHEWMYKSDCTKKIAKYYVLNDADAKQGQ